MLLYNLTPKVLAEMKRKKICKYLCLLFVAVCSVIFTTSLTAFAVHNEGSMEVTARIEAPSDEPPSSSNIDSDPNSPQTGSDSSFALWIFLLLISCSALVVTVVYEKRKNILQNKT